jgi:hypothetical protein
MAALMAAVSSVTPFPVGKLFSVESDHFSNDFLTRRTIVLNIAPHLANSEVRSCGRGNIYFV